MKMGKSVEKSLKLETYITRRKVNPNKEDNEKKKRKDSIRKVSLILKKCETLRTAEENRLLESYSDVARTISKRKARTQLYKDRVIEKEDPFEVIERKAQRLAEIISRAKHLVCYTGAGISTSARIPDYRGSQGIWTLLQQGKDIGQHDLSLADPTFTHMALYELHRRKMLRFVVSQNCDGLHLRAGLPKSALSEVHGNMYVEVCKHCKPNVEYWRLFDTTELTARFYHKTNRRCHICNTPLIDTIVHFGERGNLRWPLNWAGACAHSEKADVILCLGSSLKVLKKYSWLWQMDRPQKRRAKICIINLQWTPKDKLSTVKINGKCDEIMQLVMKYLNIKVPPYDRYHDPIFSHASLLCTEELHTVSQPMLKIQKESKESSEENENAFMSSDNDSSELTDIDNSANNCRYKENTFKETENEPLTKNNAKLVIKSSPVKSLPFVKTNLNSRHLILAENDDSLSSSDENDDESSEDDSEPDDHKENSKMEEDSCVGSNSNRTIQNNSKNENSIQQFDFSSNLTATNVDTAVKMECDKRKDAPPLHFGKGDDLINVSLSKEADKENNIFHPNLETENSDFKVKHCSNDELHSLKKGPRLSNSFDCLKDPIQISRGIEASSKIADCTEISQPIIEKNNTPAVEGKPEHTDCITTSRYTGSTEKIKLEHLLDRKMNLGKTQSPQMSSSINSKEIVVSRQNFHCDNFSSTTTMTQTIETKNSTKSSIENRINIITSAFHVFRKQHASKDDSNLKVPAHLFELSSLELAKLATTDDYYKNFLEYCKAVERKLPYWYDVGYAYSGLHSIIQPPPPEIDLWSSIIVPIFKMNKNEAECEFCFENYAEFKCQFYHNYKPEFLIKKYRSDKLIVCECCDYTDDEDDKDGMTGCSSAINDAQKIEKRAKLDLQMLKVPTKVQAGWYGKGCRKNFRRKKR